MSKHLYFTNEQEDWLRDNFYNVSSYKELTDLFNERFSTNRNSGQISDKCSKRLGLKGMRNSSQYGFKKKEQLPIGSIRENVVGTYIKCLDNADRHTSGYQEPYWLPLQKKIYQDAYGEIEPGQMVCFLDGDRHNFNLDNLYPIDRQISAVMSSNKWWTNSKEHTLTAIKWCELYYVLKGD